MGAKSEAGLASLDDAGNLIQLEALNPNFVNIMHAEANVLRSVFGVNTPVMFIKENDKPNSYAYVPDEQEELDKLGLQRGEGVVLVGVDLMNGEFNTQFRTGYGIPSLMAHEYAHILQERFDFPYANKWAELHADFMAGWYTAFRLRMAPQNMVESAISFYNKGSYDFNSPRFHGTPKDRVAAFIAGAVANFTGKVNSSRDAYNWGVVYVLARGAKR
jgi:hypothetical protein